MAARPIAKKKKTRQQPESAAATLEEIQSRGDALAEWIGNNPQIVLGGAAAILLIAAIYGFGSTLSTRNRDAASIALAEVRLEYRVAMGAPPNAYEIPEPANPEIARQTRKEFVGRFEEIAERYDGEATGSLARLHAGNLQAEIGDEEAALASWTEAADSLGKDDPLRGIVLERMAASYEEQGNFAEAAATHQQAAAIVAFPLRYAALVNAARCLAESGDIGGALAAYDRVKLESPDLVIPEYTEARLLELKAAQSL